MDLLMKYVLYLYSYCKAYFQSIKMLHFFLVNPILFFLLSFLLGIP